MHWRLLGHDLGVYAAGLCAYAMCLFILAPATLLDAGLQRASNGRLRLAEARGSLWSGTGQFEIRDATGRSGVSRDLAWHFQPQSLLHGRLGFAVDLGQAAKRFSLNISPWGLEIADADFVFRLRPWDSSYPGWRSLSPPEICSSTCRKFLSPMTRCGECSRGMAERRFDSHAGFALGRLRTAPCR